MFIVCLNNLWRTIQIYLHNRSFMNLKRINIGLLILRISLGGLMLFHGVSKLMNGIDGIKGMLAGMGMPQWLAYGVHLGETIAPILIILGFRTRLAAVFFSLVMLVAFGMAHASNFFAIGPSGGWAHELVTLYLLGGIALAFTGAGQYAVSKNNKWD